MTRCGPATSPRIAFLTESFHPVLGGGEQQVRALAGDLAGSGMAAMVITRRGESAWPAEEILAGIRVLRVPPAGSGRTGKYRMVPWALAALQREAGGYDVLVVRGTRVLGVPGIVMARALGKAVVLQAEVNGEMSGEVYTWGTRFDRPVPRRLVGLAVRARNMLLRDADAFVAMSRRIVEELRQAGVAEEKIVYLPHGVDLGRFSPAAPHAQRALRERLGLPPEGLLVTYTGRLLKGKGLETLVEAFAPVARDEPRAHLFLVGSGAGQDLSVEGALREQVGRLSLGPRVTFTGRVENVEDYLRASDVFAFPSVFEALGLSLLEASACGLACVGARTGGIVDVIEDGRSGFLVEPGDAGALARALVELLHDASRRTAFGARAREVAQARFDHRAVVESYRALFREVARRVRHG